MPPPPKFSAENWQTPCPPPPPTPLQQPPQMPAADFLLPVCCCPPISCGVPCTLQHSCSYQRHPPEYFCHQTQPPPNACSRCSAASLLLPSNFLGAPCTLYPAAQLQLPTPAPSMVVPPPPPIFCCQFLALKWQTPCPPPPPPLQQTLCHLCFLRPQPPQMPAADFLLPVCCCPPISCGVPCTPQHSCSLPTPALLMAVSPPPPPPQIFGCKPPKEHPADFLLPVPCCSGPPMFPPKRQAAQSLSPFW